MSGLLFLVVVATPIAPAADANANGVAASGDGIQDAALLLLAVNQVQLMCQLARICNL